MRNIQEQGTRRLLWNGTKISNVLQSKTENYSNNAHKEIKPENRRTRRSVSKSYIVKVKIPTLNWNTKQC